VSNTRNRLKCHWSLARCFVTFYFTLQHSRIIIFLTVNSLLLCSHSLFSTVSHAQSECTPTCTDRTAIAIASPNMAHSILTALAEIHSIILIYRLYKITEYSKPIGYRNTEYTRMTSSIIIPLGHLPWTSAPNNRNNSHAG